MFISNSIFCGVVRSSLVLFVGSVLRAASNAYTDLTRKVSNTRRVIDNLDDLYTLMTPGAVKLPPMGSPGNPTGGARKIARFLAGPKTQANITKTIGKIVDMYSQMLQSLVFFT